MCERAKKVINVTQQCFGPGVIILPSGRGEPGLRIVGPGKDIFWRMEGEMEVYLKNTSRYTHMLFEVLP